MSFIEGGDTTVISDVDYLNLLPDIEKVDIDETGSFFKGSFMTGSIIKKIEINEELA
jgi:hypothetical protein